MFTVEDSVLRTEMTVLKSQEQAPKRVLLFKPMSFVGMMSLPIMSLPDSRIREGLVYATCKVHVHQDVRFSQEQVTVDDVETLTDDGIHRNEFGWQVC